MPGELLDDGVCDDLGSDDVTQRSADLSFECRLDAVLKDVRAMIISKNTAYGNSALDPVRIFSKANTVEQIKVRIDDKLSRLVRGSDAGEDVSQDLIGYLILLRMAQSFEARA